MVDPKVQKLIVSLHNCRISLRHLGMDSTKILSTVVMLRMEKDNGCQGDYIVNWSSLVELRFFQKLYHGISLTSNSIAIVGILARWPSSTNY